MYYPLWVGGKPKQDPLVDVAFSSFSSGGQGMCIAALVLHLVNDKLGNKKTVVEMVGYVDESNRTCTPVPFLHPDVTVALSHSSLGVEERHKDASLCTQPGIVAVALLHGIFVILFSHPDGPKTNDIFFHQKIAGCKENKKHGLTSRCFGLLQFGAN